MVLKNNLILYLQILLGRRQSVQIDAKPEEPGIKVDQTELKKRATECSRRLTRVS